MHDQEGARYVRGPTKGARNRSKVATDANKSSDSQRKHDNAAVEMGAVATAARTLLMWAEDATSNRHGGTGQP